jgi:hypothetical protein
MQLGDDLENEWIMFDHFKHVEGWTTMACHIYKPMYYKVLTMSTCNQNPLKLNAFCGQD